jgi:hypothetical protein
VAWLTIVRALLHHGTLLFFGRPSTKRPPSENQGLFCHLVALNVVVLAVGAGARSWPLTSAQLIATFALAAVFVFGCIRLCEYLCLRLTGSTSLHRQAAWLLLLTLLPASLLETLLTALGLPLAPLASVIAISRLPKQIRELEALNNQGRNQ